MTGAGAWMRANLTTQGYCLTDDERRRLAVGLRFFDGAVPEPRRRRARAAVRSHCLRALRDRCRRELRSASSVRSHLEPRGPPSASGAPRCRVNPPPSATRRSSPRPSGWRSSARCSRPARARAALVLGGLLVAACARRGRDQPLSAVGAVRLARAPARIRQADHHLKGTSSDDHRGSPARHQRAQGARPAHVRGGRARARARVPLRDRPPARRAPRLPGRRPRPRSRRRRSTRSPASATSSTSPRSSRGETVLDLGSGSGMDSFLAANQVGARRVV